MFDIPYPDQLTEFEIQAYLYGALRQGGLDVRGEVTVRGAFDTADRKSSCRFDLVVYEKRKAKLIIEVKAAPVKHRGKTRQMVRYPQFGCPVRFVHGLDEAQALVSELCF